MRRIVLLSLLVLVPAGLSAALVSFTNGNVADAAAVNANFAEVEQFSASWTNNSPTDWVIASNAGTSVPLTHTLFEKGITRTGNTWTHAAKGRYMVQIQYRQQGGSDRWTQYAITKDGATNAVGQSARTGSADSAVADNFIWSYTVDSTTAAYRIVGWQLAADKVVLGTNGMSGDAPWTGVTRQGLVVNVWRVSP